MKRSLRTADYSGFLICLALLLLPSVAVEAFEASLEPSTILQGDPFLLRVTGAGDSSRPEAEFSGRQLSFVPCGEGCYVAVGAADINAKAGRHSVIVRMGGSSKSLGMKIKRHSYPVIHLTLPDARVSLSDADMERVERDDRLLKALWSKQTARMWRGSFSMPLGNEISTQYGTRRIINKTRESIHRGIDVRGREGEAVKAVNSGRVVVAEELFFGGNTLVLDHGLGIYSVYMHLSGFDRHVGDDVAGGDVIGFVGSTGRSTGPHLHFGIKAMELSVNPVSFMKLKL